MQEGATQPADRPRDYAQAIVAPRVGAWVVRGFVRWVVARCVCAVSDVAAPSSAVAAGALEAPRDQDDVAASLLASLDAQARLLD